MPLTYMGSLQPPRHPSGRRGEGSTKWRFAAGLDSSAPLIEATKAAVRRVNWASCRDKARHPRARPGQATDSSALDRWPRAWWNNWA